MNYLPEPPEKICWDCVHLRDESLSISCAKNMLGYSPITGKFVPAAEPLAFLSNKDGKCPDFEKKVVGQQFEGEGK